jgi:hypothetical protein
VNRDIAELFSGTGLQCRDNGCVIGQASNIATSCTANDQDSYGVNYILFTQNALGRSNRKWDDPNLNLETSQAQLIFLIFVTVVVAHEMGHVIGMYCVKFYPCC